jgi:CBS domain-containing protein
MLYSRRSIDQSNQEGKLKDLTVQQAKRYGTVKCNKTTSLKTAADLMAKQDISGLVVVDEEGYLAGVFTRSDLLRAGLEHIDWMDKSVENFMTQEVITVTPHTSLIEVARLLIDKQIHRVVIVHTEAGKLLPLGVISDADLTYHMAKEE